MPVSPREMMPAGGLKPPILSKVFPQLEFIPYSELLGKMSRAVLSSWLYLVLDKYICTVEKMSYDVK